MRNRASPFTRRKPDPTWNWPRTRSSAHDACLQSACLLDSLLVVCRTLAYYQELNKADPARLLQLYRSDKYAFSEAIASEVYEAHKSEGLVAADPKPG